MLLVFVVAAGGTFFLRPEALPARTSAPAIEASATKPPAQAAALYARAAAAYREGDLDTVRNELARLVASVPEEAARARIVGGLYEFVGGSAANAVDALVEVEGGDPQLEDWRLYALAESASIIGRESLAVASLAALVDAHPESPLIGRALLTAAGLAWENHDARRALALIERARAADVSGGVRTQIDTLAWRIGREVADGAIEREAARRLLVDSPAEARRLRVADIFRDADGRIDSWEGILTPTEVERRAESWLAEGQGRSAQVTLETLAAEHRGFEWEILMARALTAQGEGARAYQRLGSVSVRSAADLAALEWERAMAAADVATARRGRPNLTAEKRERMLEQAQRHLRRVIELDADRAISVQAVRELYGYLAEEGRFEDSVEMLALLRHLDPEDRTGAGHLWERGWSEYGKENYTGAIGYWTQLEQLYPGDRETHRARYWKARAFEELGEGGRARSAYRELLRTADTEDFYVRRAETKLAGGRPENAAGSLARPWPEDPRLRRTLTLSNFGLDPLAALELGILEEADASIDPQQLLAMKGILEVREGNPREGVQTLRAAFPSLGGPYQAAIPRPVLEAYYPLEYGDEIWRNAATRDLPPHLVAGIIRQESAFDRKATSWAGARGLMQLMPATAKEVSGKLGERYSPDRLYDPDFSVRLGTTYFKHVLDRFDGNVELALAGYNGGPNRIRRLWKEAGPDAELDLFLENLSISESKNYVKRILILADSYRQLYPDRPGALGRSGPSAG